MIGRFLGPGSCRLWHLLVLVVLALVSCSPQPLSVTREPTTMKLVAAGSCATLTREVAAQYEGEHPWVTVTIEVFNHRLAQATLLEKGADLGLLSWRPSTGDDGKDIWSEPFARDAIAVIVHPDSPMQEISMGQLQEIYRGHLQESEGMVLTVVSREAGSGTRAAFEHMVLGGGETSLNAVVVPSAVAMVDYVAKTSTAVGYVSTRSVDERVRILPVEGALPSAETIVNGRYPIVRAFHLVSAGEPAGEARHFAQWLLRGGAETGDALGGGLETP